jgi:uncharacterized protein DUF4166
MRAASLPQGQSARGAGLYPRLLGDAWGALAAPVRRLHGGKAGPHHGKLDVDRGRALAARALVRLLALPEAGRHVPVSLERELAEDGELWRRRFADRALLTHQSARDGELVERLGAIACFFRLEARDGALHFVQTGAALCLGRWRLRLPRALAPRIAGVAAPAGAAVRIDVRLSAPVAGLLLAYRGEIAVGGHA